MSTTFKRSNDEKSGGLEVCSRVIRFIKSEAQSFNQIIDFVERLEKEFTED